jgi:hypothetical protein
MISIGIQEEKKSFRNTNDLFVNVALFKEKMV